MFLLIYSQRFPSKFQYNVLNIYHVSPFPNFWGSHSQWVSVSETLTHFPVSCNLGRDPKQMRLLSFLWDHKGSAQQPVPTTTGKSTIWFNQDQLTASLFDANSISQGYSSTKDSFTLFNFTLTTQSPILFMLPAVHVSSVLSLGQTDVNVKDLPSVKCQPLEWGFCPSKRGHTRSLEAIRKFSPDVQDLGACNRPQAVRKSKAIIDHGHLISSE